jgi:hypothetical protein
LTAIIKKDQLKTSGEIPNQHSFGNILENYNDTVSVDKYGSKEVREVNSSITYQPGNYSNYNYSESKSSVNSTPYNPYANYEAKSNSKYEDPIIKPSSNHHQDTPFSKKIE